MTACNLSVFVPVDEHPVAHVVHVLAIKTEQPLAWVRQHADEIVKKAKPGLRYNALMVEE